MRSLTVGLSGLLALCSGCGAPDERTPPYELLSDYGFFEGPMVDLRPAEGVIPYTVAAPLWADHAGKGRYFVLPEGERAEWKEQDDWVFPPGTIFIKNFFLSTDRREPDGEAKIIETRLLVREGERWSSYTYVWNEAQTEATRVIAGADVMVDYIDHNGEPATQLYLVPDQNACESCHARDDVPVLLGPFTHQLNMEVERDGRRVNQLEWLAEQDVFMTTLPAPETLPALAPPDGDGDLDARARAYLHGNCGHCHRPGGGGGASGLSFLAWEDNPAVYGVCKVPAAAGAGAGGRSYDIVPGSPEDSIVVFRMASTDPAIKMPELPSLLSDAFGVELITEWIAAMPGDGC